MKIIISVLVLAIFAGCQTTERKAAYSIEDKILSMSEIELEEVSVSVEDSAGNGTSKVFTLSMFDYQGLALGVIYSPAEKKKLEATIESHPSETENGVQRHSGRIKISGVGALGSAVLVTSDGYFLTAAHVVANREALVSFATIEIDLEEEDSRMVPKLLPIRIVYENSEMDLAIIKADLGSAFHAKLRERPLRRGESIYNLGGFSEHVSAGRISKIKKSKHGSYYYSTSPIMGGDSGSGGFDAEGSLVGIATHAVLWKNGKKFSRFSMIPTVEISSLIEEDRIKNSIIEGNSSVPGGRD